MSEPLRGVIVSHSGVAQALVSAVALITGMEGALVPISNEGCDNDALGERLRQAGAERPAVRFVGLPGGFSLSNPILLHQTPPTSSDVDGGEPPNRAGIRVYSD